MATTTMKAMLMIDLGGNAVRGLKGLFDRLSSGGLITEKNRHHWQGMAKDIAVAPRRGLFANGRHSLKQRLPGARENATRCARCASSYRAGLTKIDGRSSLQKERSTLVEVHDSPDGNGHRLTYCVSQMRGDTGSGGWAGGGGDDVVRRDYRTPTRRR
jgi:hypothetical protein